jgi:protein TonB
MIRYSLLFLMVLALVTSPTAAQKKLKDSNTPAKTTQPVEKVYDQTNEMPEFPGEKNDLVKYLIQNTRYPELAMKNGVQGAVIVRFVIDKEGKVKDPKVVKGVGSGCDEEALRVIRSMPDWKPAIHNGKAVSVFFNLPVQFKIPGKQTMGYIEPKTSAPSSTESAGIR